MENIETATEKDIIEWALQNRNAIRNLVFVYAWNEDMVNNEGSPLTTKAKDWYKTNKDKPWFVENRGVVRFDARIHKALFAYFSPRFQGVMEDVMDKAVTYFSQFMVLGFTDEMSRTCAYACGMYLACKQTRLIEVGQLLQIAMIPYEDGEDPAFALEVMELAEPGFDRIGNPAFKAWFLGLISTCYITQQQYDLAEKYCLEGLELARSLVEPDELLVAYARCMHILLGKEQYREADAVCETALKDFKDDKNSRCYLYKQACYGAYGAKDDARLRRYSQALLKEAKGSKNYRFYGLMFTILAEDGDAAIEQETYDLVDEMNAYDIYEDTIRYLVYRCLRTGEYEKGESLVERWIDKVDALDRENKNLGNLIRECQIQFLARQGKDYSECANNLLNRLEATGQIDGYFSLCHLLDSYRTDFADSYLLHALEKYGHHFEGNPEELASIYVMVATTLEKGKSRAKAKEYYGKALSLYQSDPARFSEQIEYVEISLENFQ